MPDYTISPVQSYFSKVLNFSGPSNKSNRTSKRKDKFISVKN